MRYKSDQLEMSRTYACVDSWNGYKGTGCAATSIDDVKLRTTDVKLGAAICACGVQSDLSKAVRNFPVAHQSRLTCSTRARYWPLGKLLGIVKLNDCWSE